VQGTIIPLTVLLAFFGQQQMENSHPDRKRHPFFATLLRRVFKPDVLKDKAKYMRLKQVCRKAHNLYAASAFDAPKLFGELGRYRMPSQKEESTIGIALYDWHKKQPSKARKTKRAYYLQIRNLNELLAEQSSREGPQPKLVNLDNRKRRRWLARWAKRYNISFRQINKVEARALQQQWELEQMRQGAIVPRVTRVVLMERVIQAVRLAIPKVNSALIFKQAGMCFAHNQRVRTFFRHHKCLQWLGRCVDRKQPERCMGRVANEGVEGSLPSRPSKENPCGGHSHVSRECGLGRF